MSLLSRDLQAKASINLQSLEGITGQQGYGVIDNCNGSVIHVGNFVVDVVVDIEQWKFIVVVGLLLMIYYTIIGFMMNLLYI